MRFLLAFAVLAGVNHLLLIAGNLVPRAIVDLKIPNSAGRNSLTTDSLGNFYAAGTADGHALVVKVSSAGTIIYARPFGGSGIDQPQAIAVDATGAAYIVGITSSSDFPLVHAYLSTSNMFLSKLSPDGSTIVYSTFIGSAAYPGPTAVAVDTAGSAYVTGQASSPGFASTTGSYQAKSNGLDAFILNVAPDGSKAVWATFLGGNGPACAHLPDLSCVPVAGIPLFPNGPDESDQGAAIAIDAAGNVYVAGITNAADFPVTKDVFQTKYAVPDGKSNQGFIAKLSADGSALLYSTYIGTPAGDFLNALLVNASGEAIVGGATFSDVFPTTPGALAPGPHHPGGWIAKLNANGSTLVYATYLGNGNVNGIVQDNNASLYVTGYNDLNSPFPITPGASPVGYPFFTQLDANGATLLYSTLLPNGSAGNAIALSASGAAVLGAAGVLTLFGHGDPAQPAVYALANAASSLVIGHVAPGEIVAVSGVGFGPASPVSFDGITAPIFGTQQNRIILQVPFEIARSSTTTLQLTDSSGQAVQSLVLAVAPADPGVITLDGHHAAAINQDGSLNSTEHPAPLGSSITIFGTGSGLWAGSLSTGEIAPSALTFPQLPVLVLISVPQASATQHSATVLYAGSAPSLSDGVLQVNLRLPAAPDLGNGPEVQLILQVGGIQSPPVTLYVPH